MSLDLIAEEEKPRFCWGRLVDEPNTRAALLILVSSSLSGLGLVLSAAAFSRHLQSSLTSQVEVEGPVLLALGIMGMVAGYIYAVTHSEKYNSRVMGEEAPSDKQQVGGDEKTREVGREDGEGDDDEDEEGEVEEVDRVVEEVETSYVYLPSITTSPDVKAEPLVPVGSGRAKQKLQNLVEEEEEETDDDVINKETVFLLETN